MNNRKSFELEKRILSFLGYKKPEAVQKQQEVRVAEVASDIERFGW